MCTYVYFKYVDILNIHKELAILWISVFYLIDTIFNSSFLDKAEEYDESARSLLLTALKNVLLSEVEREEQERRTDKSKRRRGYRRKQVSKHG